jgi:hypothetical protein
MKKEYELYFTKLKENKQRIKIIGISIFIFFEKYKIKQIENRIYLIHGNQYKNIKIINNWSV